MLIYKKVECADAAQLRELIDRVLSSLERKEFFIPYEQWELDRMFDETYALLHGAYDGDKLVGIAQLYCDQSFTAECVEILGLEGERVCELGGNLVLPEYRGKGIMYCLIKLQSELARIKGYTVAIALAHPENFSSVRPLEKLGMQYVKTHLLKDEYLRNIYILRLQI